MTNTIDLAEGARIRIGGTSFDIERVIDEHEPLALVVARRVGRAAPAPGSTRSDPSLEDPFPHVDDDIHPLLWGSAFERLERFRLQVADEAPWIDRDAQRQIVKRLQDLTNTLDGSAPRYLAIVGLSGAGKRSAVGRFLDEWPARARESARPSVPTVTVRSWVSAQQLYETCIDGVDVHGANLSRMLRRPGLKNKQRREIAINAMKAAGVRLLVVENLHNYVLPTPGQVRQRIETLDTFVGELEVALVCIHDRPLSLPDSVSSPWHRAPQLTLERCAVDSEFELALRSFERRLPLREPSRLDRPAVAGRLHALSHGILGDLWSRLVDYTEEALRSGRERIDHALIDRTERTGEETNEAASFDD